MRRQYKAFLGKVCAHICTFFFSHNTFCKDLGDPSPRTTYHLLHYLVLPIRSLRVILTASMNIDGTARFFTSSESPETRRVRDVRYVLIT
jgi:hypothetical protein